MPGPVPRRRATSAAAQRERHAATYLRRVRPTIIALSIVLSLFDWLVEPDSISRGTWFVLAGFAACQVLLYILLATSMRPTDVVAVSFVIDSILFICILPFVVAPTNAAGAIVVLVAACSYFRPARETAIYATVVALAVTFVGPRVPDWSDPAPIPASAFTIFITGMLLAYLTSRMRRTELELERVVASQRDALDRLEQVDRSRDRLIANVSHELRTPLTSTIGSIETVLREDIGISDSDRTELLHAARDGGLRLLALVEELLAIGATRPDSLDLSTGRERLATLVREAVVGIEPGEGRTIRIDAAYDPAVVVDRMRMLQVISNLVVNAVRHGAGDIVVSTDVGGGDAVLRVVDDGAGVPAEHVAELFLPFARFSSRTDSTGLGLAICHAIVEAHGGTITYERTADDRTSFVVRLPATRSSTRGE